jgi:hypothetical protein
VPDHPQFRRISDARRATGRAVGISDAATGTDEFETPSP